MKIYLSEIWVRLLVIFGSLDFRAGGVGITEDFAVSHARFCDTAVEATRDPNRKGEVAER
jgi:hypothetical protein